MKKALAIVALLTMSGCALIFNKSELPVKFDSYPQGAKVIINGEFAGITPVTISLRSGSNKYTNINYISDNHSNISFKVRSSYRGGVACNLDMIGGSFFVFPLISLFTDKCQKPQQLSYFKALDQGTRSNIRIELDN